MTIAEQRWHVPLSFLVAGFVSILMLSGVPVAAAASPIIIDHSCTNITAIPQSAIDAARANLHIAYGHTSHGSQLTDGMSGLVSFSNNGGKGLALPIDIFEWKNGGIGGAMDLHYNA
ncbi:hypothetical protein, partial [Desulfosarcina sp.]|uniref:hypothetical protein n=1 Tax=Desulfosarcina sp. TaxID=2027861 RepID=UPI0029BC5354